MRGELCHRVDNHINSFGSSPLARRTLETGKLTIDDGRFIPACAGNSDLLNVRNPALAVHPRLRGELRNKNVTAVAFFGSSPLARGTHHGNYQYWCHHTVHPRLRGELRLASDGDCLKCGSSPLARGTPIIRPINLMGFRFIPACAGNSFDFGVPFILASGSSPLARGTLSRHTSRKRKVRFIPACAGNSVLRTAVDGDN